MASSHVLNPCARHAGFGKNLRSERRIVRSPPIADDLDALHRCCICGSHCGSLILVTHASQKSKASRPRTRRAGRTHTAHQCWPPPSQHLESDLNRFGNPPRDSAPSHPALDKSQDRTEGARGHYSSATYVANAGIPVWIDDAPAIAHNKVIIIDAHLVVTGSSDFTKSADTRNAENVVMIESAGCAGFHRELGEPTVGVANVRG